MSRAARTPEPIRTRLARRRRQARRAGNSVRLKTVSLVRPFSRRPGTSGTSGLPPVQITARRNRTSVPSRSSVLGPVNRAVPNSTSTPRRPHSLGPVVAGHIRPDPTHPLHHRREVHLDRAGTHAELARPSRGVGDLRAGDERLGRDATRDQTVAAQVRPLDQRGPGPEQGRTARGDQPRRSAADGDEVVNAGSRATGPRLGANVIPQPPVVAVAGGQNLRSVGVVHVSLRSTAAARTGSQHTDGGVNRGRPLANVSRAYCTVPPPD